jgi:nitrogen fixation/metabolism regulation signal transduction histidine kinase
LHNSFYAIVKNAIEANPAKVLNIEFSLNLTKNSIEQDNIERDNQKDSNNKDGGGCHRIVGSPRFISLLISNNGEAIPEKITQNLFEFGVSSKLPGSHNFGIGLAMTKKIIYEHNAEIKLVANRNYEQVSFQFSFPLERYS